MPEPRSVTEHPVVAIRKTGGMAITARQGFNVESNRYRQLVLRSCYRKLRRAGLDRYQSRSIIGSVVYSATIGAKP